MRTAAAAPHPAAGHLLPAKGGEKAIFLLRWSNAMQPDDPAPEVPKPARKRYTLAELMDQCDLDPEKLPNSSAPADDETARPRAPRKRYTLDELIGRCDFSIPPSEEEVEWDRMKPVGREIF